MSDIRDTNYLLLVFDILLMPIHIMRLIIIYIYGSKYNLKGFQFLDVIMHADKPYFNQDNCSSINTIGKDYRVSVRDDCRIFPIDVQKYFVQENIIISGSTDANNSRKRSISDDSNDSNDSNDSELSDDNSSNESDKIINGVNHYGGDDEKEEKKPAQQPSTLDSVQAYIYSDLDNE